MDDFQLHAVLIVGALLLFSPLGVIFFLPAILHTSREVEKERRKLIAHLKNEHCPLGVDCSRPLKTLEVEHERLHNTS